MSATAAAAPGALLRGFSVLLVWQVVGEALTHAFALPVPGPVLGMVALLLALVLSRPLRTWIGASADTLLAHLSLLFVPAGVGVVLYLQSLASDAWKLVVIILVSTWVGLAVTAWVAHRLLKAPKS